MRQQLPKSNVDILDDGWLTGFTDAGGNFYVRHTIKGNPIKARVEPRFRLQQQMFYPKTLKSYEPIFGSIGNSLGVKLNISRRKNPIRL